MIQLRHILIIFVLISIYFHYRSTDNSREDFCGTSSFVENTERVMLNKPDIYIRPNIPLDLRLKIYGILNKNLLSTMKKVITPIDIDFLQIIKYSDMSTDYLTEIFLLNKTDYSTTKFVISFTYTMDNVFMLKDMRPYSYKDSLKPNSNIYGVDTDLVLQSENIDLIGSYNPIIDTQLTCTDIDFTPSNVTHKNIYDYNNTILPQNITSKSHYVTMTPDFYNNNLFTMNTANDLFSRTRGIPSFPTGKST